VPSRRRFDARREVALGLGVYTVYLAVRHRVFNDHGRERAARNAVRIVTLEKRLGLHVEPTVQRVCLGRRRLIAGLNVGYVTLNVVLTIGTLARLFARRHPEFHRFRRAAALATLGAQPVFLLFPAEPPRKLDGFTDTIREVSGLDLDGELIARLYNPVAAMPSIHLAYAVVTAAALTATASTRTVRIAARAYPPAVFGTVLATANHYVLDGLAGSVLGLTAVRLARETKPRKLRNAAL
jgi:hypothetical protein